MADLSPETVATELAKCADRVSLWLGMSCPAHVIPRTEIAALATWARESVPEPAAIASDRALNAAPAEPGAACPTCGSDRNERDELIKAEREIERLRGLVAAPAAAGEAVAPMLSCDIQPRPLSYPLSDYHRAGFAGPLHFTWADKPHRLLYDLIAAVRYYAAPAAPAEPAPQPEPVNAPSDFHNPWRTLLENCISGDNYLRASEYRDLIEDLDDLYRMRAAEAAQPARPSLRDELQRKCYEWGAYWRAPDAHGVELTHDQALELLRDALGVEVDWKQAEAAQPEPVNAQMPDGWVPLRLEWEPGYPEDVAFGPQRMMDRLKKWLDKHFARCVAESAAEAAQPEPAAAQELSKIDAEYWLRHRGDILDAITAAGFSLCSSAARFWLQSLPNRPTPQPAPAGVVDAELVTVPRALIRRAQQAINYHLEPDSPNEHEATMLELARIGWPALAAADAALSAPQPVQPFPPRILAQIQDMADRTEYPGHGPWHDGEGNPLQDDADAALAWIAAVQPVQAVAVPSIRVTKIESDFRWDGDKLQHVPSLHVEFEPVPAGQPNNAKGWADRDALAEALYAHAITGAKAKP